MLIKLYQNNGEMTKVDKTGDLIHVADLNGTLREETSIQRPTIYVEIDVNEIPLRNNIQKRVTAEGNLIADVSIDSHSSALAVNYCYIPEFSRYYFISEITSVRKNLWRLILREDVLFSFARQIKNTSALIYRNANDYDLFIEDKEIPYKYNKVVTETVVTNTGEGVTELCPTTIIPSPNCIAVSFLTPQAIYGASTYYVEKPDGVLPTVYNKYTNTTRMATTICTNKDKIDLLSTRLCSSSDSMAQYKDFLLSIILFPFVLPHEETQQDFRIGYNESNTVTGYMLGDNNPQSRYTKIADFVVEEPSSFIDYEPYTHTEFYLPYVGWIDLSISSVGGHNLAVYYVVDYSDGSATVIITDKTDNKLIYTNTCQIGVTIPINSTNAYEIGIRRFQNTQNLINGVIGGIGKTGTGIAKGGYLGAVEGVTSTVTSISNFITSAMTTHENASAVINSGNSGLYLPQKCRIRKTSYITAINDDNYSQLRGRPLNQWRRIGNLTGFTKVADCHLENFTFATDSEIDEIYSLLTDGVIL